MNFDEGNVATTTTTSTIAQCSRLSTPSHFLNVIET